MTGHESLDGPVFVKPILPPMKDHPGLNVAKSLISYFHLVKKSRKTMILYVEDGTKMKLLSEIQPPLKALWQDQKDREFNFDFKKSWAELDKKVHKQRWRLYSWIINPNLTDLALLLKVI